MNNRTMLPNLINNATAGDQGSVKIKFFKGAGLMSLIGFYIITAVNLLTYSL